MDQSAATDQAIPMVLHSRSGGIATLTLNRAAQFNALSEQMMDALQAELDALAQDAAVRVVVLAAEGRAFCAGHDLKQMRATPELAYYQTLFTQCSKLMLTIQQMPQPVIARVQGIATAAGCQLVAMCDLAVASSTARFAVSGINFGLFCATPSVALSRNVSRKQAMEMLLTGDGIDAVAAERWGLINKVVPKEELMATAYAYARRIAVNAPLAVQAAKELALRSRDIDLTSGLRLEAVINRMLQLTEDSKEGSAAFAAKRAPNFKGQ